jgi:HPt (histidine-containing phosphotransfer) domain-containing protein
VVDERVLAELKEATGGDGVFLSTLIDAFLSDSPIQLASMRRARADGDDATLARAAHSLKSNSASLGALDLSTLCQKVEAAALAHEIDTAAGVLADVEDEYEKVARALARVSRAERGGEVLPQ